MRLITTFIFTISHAIAVNATDLAGTWAIELSAPNGQIYRPEATITKTEDKLEGSYYSPSLDQTLDLRDVKLDAENTLQFNVDIEDVKVAYSGRIGGDKIVGSAKIFRQGRQFEATFTASRKAKTDSVSGTWDMETVMRGNTSQSILLLAVANDGKISAIRKSNEDAVEFDDVELVDGVLTFSTKGNRRGYDYTAHYKGDVEGDKIEGEFVISVEAAGLTRKFAWSAKKAD